MTEKIRILTWNVAGLNKKEKSFWKEMRKYNFVGLTETCLEKINPKIEKYWRESYEWAVVKARRETEKGRAKGGIVVGVKKSMECENRNKKQ